MKKGVDKLPEGMRVIFYPKSEEGRKVDSYLSVEGAFVAMTIVSVMNTEVKAQENNFITNEEVKNELVVAKTIFKQDGAQLYRHIRYEYSYDDQTFIDILRIHYAEKSLKLFFAL